MTVELTDRDRSILDHLKRYRITTNEVLETRFFGGDGHDALKTVRRRLVGAFLQARPLGIGRRRYYQLTPRAARMFGEPEEVAAPLGTQALPRAYAVLVFCCLSGKRRERLHRDELREEYPELAGSSLATHSDLYIDEWGGKPRLARILVDYGGETAALVRKCHRFLAESRDRIAGFSNMLRQDAFTVTILTGEETKKQSIIDALTRKPLDARVRIEVIGDLTTLLHPAAEP